MDHSSIPLQPAKETKPTTSISKVIFQTLPIGVQKDYARFYGLSDTDRLTTDDICRVLFRETDWTPALEIEGHVRHITTGGAVVAREAMDLVDWIVEHHVNDSATPDNLERTVQQLQAAHSDIKTAVQVSRETARDAWADIFALQGRLYEENTYQHTALRSITGIVGMDHAESFEGHLDMATWERRIDLANDSSTPEQKSHDRQTNVSSKYHTIQCPPSPQRYQATVLDSSIVAPHRSTSLKRSLEVHNADYEPPPSNLHGTSLQHPKRARIEGPSPPGNSISPANDPQTILNYPSEDGHDDQDSSYSDSNGTERDFIDDPYSFYGPHGKGPFLEELSGRYSSTEQEVDDWDLSNDSALSFRWSATESDSDCLNDPDFFPSTAWDLEDVLELDAALVFEKKIRLYSKFYFGQYDIHPLQYFKYMDELFDCGGALSGGDISSDDSEQDHLYPEMTQRSAFRGSGSQSLGSLLHDPLEERYADPQFYFHIHTIDDDTIAMLKRQEHRRSKEAQWRFVQRWLYDPDWRKLDLDRRLDDILPSDHSHFYFDDREWMHFEEPTPGVFPEYSSHDP